MITGAETTQPSRLKPLLNTWHRPCHILDFGVAHDETSQMREAALQNHMTLDLLTAAQGGTCTILHIKCGIYIPDYQTQVQEDLQEMHAEVPAIQALQQKLLEPNAGNPWDRLALGDHKLHRGGNGGRAVVLLTLLSLWSLCTVISSTGCSQDVIFPNL